MTTFYKAITV